MEARPKLVSFLLSLAFVVAAAFGFYPIIALLLLCSILGVADELLV